ncbi:hypothetical protein U1Q18_051601 [Sarracenia purpurea var. burkii]
MDGRGGCCIARYPAGGAYDLSSVDQIMLRFRPIAPKPAAAAAGSASGGSSVKKNEVYCRGGRGKRRYVRDGKNSSCSSSRRGSNNKKRKASSEETDRSGGSVYTGEAVVTLSLLPETPDRKESTVKESPVNFSDLNTVKQADSLPIWLNFSNSDEKVNNEIVNDDITSSGAGNGTPVVIPQPVRVLGSIVTVECVMETGGEGYGGVGCKDEEWKESLEKDTCPGFISDGYNRVGWTNGAYRKMVGQKGGAGAGGAVVVWLVMKDRVPITYGAFTCRVRVQYTCGKERNSLTLPCDVWKMDGDGFAWRLDVKAALCLGR